MSQPALPAPKEITPNDVTIVFKDALLNFTLPVGATLEDLAQRLAGLGERYAGLPLYIDVRIRDWRQEFPGPLPRCSQ